MMHSNHQVSASVPSVVKLSYTTGCVVVAAHIKDAPLSNLRMRWLKEDCAHCP
jgi:hypothetical protein